MALLKTHSATNERTNQWDPRNKKKRKFGTEFAWQVSKKKNEIARLFYGHVPTLSPMAVEAERLNTATNKE